MPIQQLTPQAEIDAYLYEQLQRMEAVIVRNMLYIGEQCMNAARSSDSYIDRTGNLRSSVGYVLISDGNIIQMSSFQSIKGGADGSREGQEFARKVTSEFPKGVALVVVAGMNYAGYVADRGYDVLDSAELLADKLVPQILTQLGFVRR